jgi:hypothetical protein
MVTKTVYREVAVDVDVDLVDYDTDELIEEIEYRDGGNKWEVVDKQNTEFVSDRMKDDLYNLYRDYISGSSNFEGSLKALFESHLDVFIA